MLDFHSPVFIRLSDKAKLLLSLSFQFEKEITNDPVFYGPLNLIFPEEEMLFQNIVTEIQLSKIDYSIKKIKFIAPSRSEIQVYIQAQKTKHKRPTEELLLMANYFFDFYEKKNWMIKSKKMQNWKIALTFAINNWTFPNYTNSKKTPDKIQSIAKSHDDFMKLTF